MTKAIYSYTENRKVQVESAPNKQVKGMITLRETKAYGGSVMMSLADAKETVKILQQAILFREMGIDPNVLVECVKSWDDDYKAGKTYHALLPDNSKWMWIYNDSGRCAIMGDIGKDGVILKNGSVCTTFKQVG